MKINRKYRIKAIKRIRNRLYTKWFLVCRSTHDENRSLCRETEYDIDYWERRLKRYKQHGKRKKY